MNMDVPMPIDPALVAHDVAAAMEFERKKRQFRRCQVAITNKFRRHRRAADHHISMKADEFPLLSNKGKVQHIIHQVNNIQQVRYLIHRFRPNYRRSVSNIQEVDKRRYGRSRINEVSRKLFAYGIRFRRIISCGGMGMAALFEVQNRSTGLYNKIVAKIALSERYNKDIAKEKKYLNIVKDDAHFLKLKNINELRSMTGGYPSETVNGAQSADPSGLPEPTEQQMKELDADNNIMLTEYLPFGSLNHWIGKAYELDKEFSTEACWRMLLCLAKAAQAMKHPSPNANSSGAQADDIVHFDLDPSNILVDGKHMTAYANGVDCGDPDGAGPSTCDHDRSLLLKVADFGLASTISEDVKRDYEKLWLLRSGGKALYYAPEQWTAEWDAVRENPLSEDMEVAGNYSSKTNIYQIGIIMIAILMRTQPEPVPRVLLVPIADYRDEDHAYLDQTVEENSALLQVQIHSLGWLMAHEDCIRLYEPSLRELVVRLTAYVPKHRPSPEELVKICEDRINRGFAGAGIYLDDAWWINTTNIPTEAAPTRPFRPSRGAVNSQHTLSDDSSSSDEPLPDKHTARQAEAALALAQFARQAIERPAMPHIPAALMDNSPLPSPVINNQNQNPQHHRAIGNVAAAFAGLPLSTRRPPTAVPFFGAPIVQNQGNGPMNPVPGAVRGLRHPVVPGNATGPAMNAAANARHERAMQAVYNAHHAQAAREVQAAREMQAVQNEGGIGNSRQVRANAANVRLTRQAARAQRQQNVQVPGQAPQRDGHQENDGDDVEM